MQELLFVLHAPLSVELVVQPLTVLVVSPKIIE